MNMDVVMEALGIMGKGMLGIYLRGDCGHRVAGLPADQNHFPEKVLTKEREKGGPWRLALFFSLKSKIYLTFRIL